MSEKKIITIRFHLNRQRDRCAWENLEKLKSISRKSYNDILVEMLAEQRWGLEQSDIEDLAWRLCTTVKDQLNEYLLHCATPTLAPPPAPKSDDDLDPDVDWDYLDGF